MKYKEKHDKAIKELNDKIEELKNSSFKVYQMQEGITANNSKAIVDLELLEEILVGNIQEIDYSMQELIDNKLILLVAHNEGLKTAYISILGYVRKCISNFK